MVRSTIDMTERERYHWQRLAIAGGCGHVGLPLGLVFDRNRQRGRTVNPTP